MGFGFSLCHRNPVWSIMVMLCTAKNDKFGESLYVRMMVCYCRGLFNGIMFHRSGHRMYNWEALR
jgi:hypothetical protein